MGNNPSLKESQGQQRPAAARPVGQRRSVPSGSSYTEPPHLAPDAELADWEVLSSVAPQQMPSQQYYPAPAPWFHDQHLGSNQQGHERSRDPSAGARPRPRAANYVQLGLTLAEGVLNAIAEERERQQQSNKKKEEEEEESGEEEVKKKGEEEEEERLPVASAPPPPLPSSPPPLPSVCYHHPSCSLAGCDRLHLCHLFLAGLCQRGDTCRRGHSLTTVHNQWVCDIHGLDIRRNSECLALLQSVCQQNDWLPASLYRDAVRICFWSACDGTCSKLHICRYWVTEQCSRPVCRFSHDLRSAHNRDVLRRHRLDGESDAAIRDLLGEKYACLTPKAAAAAAGGGAGAGGAGGKNRERPPGQGTVAAADSLSDELQCPVCLELFNKATTLGCGHTFCADCVGAVRRCPLCRATIATSTRSVTLDSIIGTIAAAR